jgi:L,D-peptidoglycan transpeptidase YkuD (ErfK/YbiS/YcfS/YnhG family)
VTRRTVLAPGSAAGLLRPVLRIIVEADGWLTWPGGHVRCALGRSGVRSDKREGDGATPAGCHPLRRVLYRPDREAAPDTRLPVRPLQPGDGWCDDPGDAAYNRPVTTPYPARHERMWRDDGLYDIVAVLGYNDMPGVAGRGSAIFLHVASPDYQPTQGCVALSGGDLRRLLADCAEGDRLCIRR